MLKNIIINLRKLDFETIFVKVNKKYYRSCYEQHFIDL